MSKKKRRLSVNWDKCLCHSYSSSGGNLELFTQKSWGSLCMAAKRRQDDRCVLKEYIIRVVELPRDVSVLLKHQSCYAATLEKSVHLCETRRNRHCEDDSTPIGTSRAMRLSIPKTRPKGAEFPSGGGGRTPPPPPTQHHRGEYPHLVGKKI